MSRHINFIDALKVVNAEARKTFHEIEAFHEDSAGVSGVEGSGDEVKDSAPASVVKSLQLELEAYKKDAARYHWICGVLEGMKWIDLPNGLQNIRLTHEKYVKYADLDYAIDTAIMSVEPL